MRRPSTWRFATILPALVATPMVFVVTGTTHGHAYDPLSGPPAQSRVLSGFANFELKSSDVYAEYNQPTTFTPVRSENRPQDYFGSQEGCGVQWGSNARVDTFCLALTEPGKQGHAQASNGPAIAVSPLDGNNVIATTNDFSHGDSACGANRTGDNSSEWMQGALPHAYTDRTSSSGIARQYWQTGGAPTVAWDSLGNAYSACQLFNRGNQTPNPNNNNTSVSSNPDLSSAVYVFRSMQNQGASWSFGGTPVVVSAQLNGPDTTSPFEDRPAIAVDTRSRAHRDTIYVVYTEFAADGSANIYEQHSNDHGLTFGDRVLVSASSPTCVSQQGLGNSAASTCNLNQFGDPFLAPDGTLYVAFVNYNVTPIPAPAAMDNRQQVLLAKSIDGGTSFTAPVKVGDFYDLPDCGTYENGQNAGRACVPEKAGSSYSYFAAANYASGAVNPLAPSQVVVAYGSYINRTSKETNGCMPNGTDPNTGQNLYAGPAGSNNGVKTQGACHNAILLSTSSNGGGSFTGGATTADARTQPVVTQAPGQASTDQWWPSAGFTQSDDQPLLAVAYYDRQYITECPNKTPATNPPSCGLDETTGYSDVSISGTKDGVSFRVNRVTTSSMPPPTQFDGLFLGDDLSLAINGKGADVAWTDTRNPDVFNCPGGTQQPQSGNPPSPPNPAVCYGSGGINSVVANAQFAYAATTGVPNGP